MSRDPAACPSGADPTLAELLDGAQPVGSGSAVHDSTAALMAQIAAQSTGSRRFTLELRDPLDWVRGCVFQLTGRPVGSDPTWVHFVDPKRGTGLLVVLHSPVLLPYGGAEVDFVLVGHAGMLARGVVVDVARWAFLGAGAHRLVARIPADRTDLQDYARRGGFLFEGVARDFFGIGADAQVWAMTGARCPWLPRPVSPIPTADVSPPSSLKVH